MLCVNPFLILSFSFSLAHRQVTFSPSFSASFFSLFPPALHLSPPHLHIRLPPQPAHSLSSVSLSLSSFSSLPKAVGA